MPISYFRFPIIGYCKLEILVFVKVIWGIRYFRYRKQDTQFFVEIICWLSRFRFPTFRISEIWNSPNYFNKNVNMRFPISELSEIANLEYPKSISVCFYPSLFISNFIFYCFYFSLFLSIDLYYINYYNLYQWIKTHIDIRNQLI